MSILVEFYQKVVRSLGLYPTDDGYIKVSKDGSFLVKSEKEPIPLVLPTKEHVKTLLEEENGKVKIVKLPFNPLDENALKGETISIKKMKTIIQLRLTQLTYTAGLLLLKLGTNEKAVKSPNMELVDFLSRMTKLKKPNVKKLIDDKVVEAFHKVYEKSKELNLSFIKIHIRKNSTYKGVKYHKLVSVKSDVYTELCNGDTFGLKLRAKDIDAIKIVFEYLLGVTPDEDVVSFGSNDKLAPSFVALMECYLSIGNKALSVINQLAFLDQELADSIEFTIEVTDNELKTLEVYKSELLTIPSLSDLETTMHNSRVNQPTIVEQQTQQPVVNNNPVIQQQVTNQQPAQQTNVDDDPTRSVVSKIMSKYQHPMGGMNMYPQPTVQPAPQPVVNTTYPQQPMMNQPMVNQGYQQPNMGYGQPVQQTQQRPVGINTALTQSQMNNTYQQPVMGYGQQPMMNQGWGQQQMNMGYNQPMGYGQQRPMGVNGMIR